MGYSQAAGSTRYQPQYTYTSGTTVPIDNTPGRIVEVPKLIYQVLETVNPDTIIRLITDEDALRLFDMLRKKLSKSISEELFDDIDL